MIENISKSKLFDRKLKIKMSTRTTETDVAFKNNKDSFLNVNKTKRRINKMKRSFKVFNVCQLFFNFVLFNLTLFGLNKYECVVLNRVEESNREPPIFHKIHRVPRSNAIINNNLNNLNNNINILSSSGSIIIDNNDNSNQFANYILYSEIKNRLEVFPSPKTIRKANTDDNKSSSNDLISDEIQPNGFKYEIENSIYKITDFKEISIDYLNEFIYVGAKNHLIKISFKNNSLNVIDLDNDILVWEPNIDAINDCRRLNSIYSNKYCHNYLRVIQLEPSSESLIEKIDEKSEASETNEIGAKLLLCGTYANKPMCTWRNKNHLLDVIESFDGIGKCPPSPDSSSTYLRLKNGDYYFGSSIDYSEQGMKADYLIDRSLGPSKQIRTDQYNSNWLNDPTFVASITIGDYVYFFIRETAIEYMNCGQKIYSRVARLCKYDQGMENYDIWRTFEKARLNCSVPSANFSSSTNHQNIYYNLHHSEHQQYPFYFDEIQNVYFDKSKNLIYAIFSTPLNGVKGSAICIYDVASLENAFNGPFMHQKTKDSIWEPYNQPIDKIKCEPTMQSTKLNSDKTKYVDSHKFQLKYLSVQPMFQRPILVLPNQRLLKLVVDNVITKHQNNAEILFIATEHNTILKYMLLNMPTSANLASSDPFDSDTSNSFSKENQFGSQNQLPIVCLLEEIEVLDTINKKSLNSINNLVLLNSLSDFNSDSDGLRSANIASKSNRHLLIATSFNLIKMPVANCETQTNYFSCLSLMDPYCIWDSKAQKCLLIFKTNETLFYSSKEYSYNNGGRTIAQNIKSNTHLHQHSINSCSTTNIPVDGGFSEWSSWSNCVSKTGEKCKCRMRLCNSPEPRNGGKNCDENAAIEILNCEVNGGWTSWSAWSACKGGQATNCDLQQTSANIQPAVRTRFRTCTNPEPKFNGRICVGLDQEEEICTPEMINPCGNLNNHQWMTWGAWDECSRTCGEGFQMRRRVCNGKNCFGCNQEWRTCNSEPCKERIETAITDWDIIELNKESRQKLEKRIKFSCKYDHFMEVNNLDGMELNTSIEYRICEDEKFCRSITNLKELGIFSQWSEWSKCKDCGDEQYRSRKCTVSNTCFGHEREMRECKCINEKTNGWSCWSDFTPCSTNCGKGVQMRTRECLLDHMECIGLKEEISNCFSTNCSNFDGIVSNEKIFSSLTGHQHTNFLFSLTHLIITSILTFLLGSLAVLLIIYIYFKPKSKMERKILCCCKSRNTMSSQNDVNEKHLSSSLDHNSVATDTAATDVINLQTNDCGKIQYCLTTSDSSCTSSNSTHSKEYFTIGNRFDPSGLSSLLNDVIPDDDDELVLSSGGGNGTSTLSKKNQSKSNILKQNGLPNKSFNTYTNHKDLNKNSKIGSGVNNGSISINTSGSSNGSAICSINNNNNNNSNNSRYLNYNNMTNGSIRSTVKQQRTPFAFSMRTNLDQEL